MGRDVSALAALEGDAWRIAALSMMSGGKLRALLQSEPQEAAPWVQAAAHMGLIEGQIRFGRMLLSGEGVAKDETAAFAWFARAAAAMYDFGPDDVVVNGFPLFHVAGAFVYGLSALASGATLLIPGRLGMRNRRFVETIWKSVESYRVTAIGGVPTVISALNEVAVDADISSLRVMLTGGSPLPSELADAFEKAIGKPVRNILGMTECAGVVTIEPFHGPRTPGSTGLRLPFTEVAAFRSVAGDVDLAARCKAGETGVVALRGPNVGPGYSDQTRNPGTFEFFANRGDGEAVRLLADYVIARHYPDAAADPRPYRSLLDAVIARTAALVAQWQLVGFIHGVMNTDNMSIAGETIDYGPCAFMDAYDPATVYSSIDTVGRYAYGNQPRIAKWHLARLAEALLPLLAEDKDAAIQEANAALGAYATRFETAHSAGLRRKLGLFEPLPDDLALAHDLLERMARNNADFTLTFRRLCDAAVGPDGHARSLFTDPSAFDDWADRWHRRLTEDGAAADERRASMRAVNPAFIPRNHLVEEALTAAVNDGDLSPFEALLTVLSKPHEDQPTFSRYADPPRPEQVVLQTFCGT